MKKRMISLLVALVMLIGTLPVTVLAKETRKAAETEWEYTYSVYTAEDLVSLPYYIDGSCHYILMADIEFTPEDFEEGGAFYNEGKGWEPVSFNGTFDGNDHAIRGLKTSSGLFQIEEKSTVCNLSVLDVQLVEQEATTSLGAITLWNDGTITGCRVSAVFSSETYSGSAVGGIVASNSGTISNCTSDVSFSILESEEYDGYWLRVGAIAGYNRGIITECESNGSVASNIYGMYGGIAGENMFDSFINACENYVNISAICVKSEASVGGITGQNGGKIDGCKNYGDLEATGPLGGIAGEDDYTLSSISNSENNGNITHCDDNSDSLSDTGGIIGESWNASSVTKCVNNGTIRNCADNTAAGGIVGSIIGVGEIKQCINTGIVEGKTEDFDSSGKKIISTAGGIAGKINAVYPNDDEGLVTVFECCNTGEVTAYSAGGIIGAVSTSNDDTSEEYVLVHDVYNTGSVFTENNVDHWIGNAGGLISSIQGFGVNNKISLENGFNMGSVTASGDNARAIALIAERGGDSVCAVNNLYYVENGPDPFGFSESELTLSNVQALTVEAFAKQANFAGFDFDTVWAMSETTGHPYLQAIGDDSAFVPGSDNQVRIISQYPQNGATGIVNTVKKSLIISMTFNHDVADVADASEGKGFFEIYKLAADGFTPTRVYRLEDKAADVTISGKSVKIDVSAADFVNNAMYIIVMGPKVISFTDTDETIEIVGTQWKFETGAFVDGDYEGVYGSSFSFADSYFADGNSSVYNHDLALASCNLAIAAYNASDAPEKDYQEAVASKQVREMLVQLGFSEESIDTSLYEGKPSQKSIAAAIATKELNIDSQDEKWTLLVIAVRGGNYEAEWGNNFWIGETGNHCGFQNAANQVKNHLKTYLKANPIEGNVAVWITGYSRGAATANLLSADLHTSSACSYVGLKLDPRNIYTYTFETPMGLSEDNYRTYDNIFNIVNPIDLVTKVAPAKWNFMRYGVDCMFPSTGTSSHYSEYLQQVSQYYTSFSGRQLPAEYTAYKLNVDLDFGVIPHIYMTNDINSTRLYQSDFLEEFINDGFCTDFFESRAQYCEELEDVLQDLMASICGNTINKSALTDQILNELADALLDWAVEQGLIKVVGKTVEKYIELVDFVSDFSKDSLAHRLARILIEGNVINMQEDELAEDMHALLNVNRILSFGILHFEELYTLIVNYRWLAVAHEPQFCLAWMNTVTDGYITNENGKKYRVLTVNCPVDVQVYDSSDSLVAAIIDDFVQEIPGSTIGTQIDVNGQKVFILPSDEAYRVDITATGQGTMTYSVSEYDLSLGETTRVVNYYDVELTNGERLTGIVEMLEGETPVEYTLQVENGEQIPVSEDLRGEAIEHYMVRTQTVGNGTVNGGGVFIRGEYVRVIAFPKDGAFFLGWYCGDMLLSTESEYRFCVKQDWEIIAKFSTTGQTILNIGKETEKACSSFSDVCKTDWFCESVQYVTAHGLMNGVGGGKFAPNATLTRAMLVQVLYNLEGKPAVSGSSEFADVASGAWYADAVSWAAENGIVTGYAADRFGPEDAVTREQTAAIFQRYAAYRGLDTSASGSLSQFADAAAVSAYAQHAVAWAVDTGLLSGKGGGRLDPAGTATRAEIAAILMRFCENVLK